MPVGFTFRNHTAYITAMRPRFAGEWTRLSDSGSVERWLSAFEDSAVVVGTTTHCVSAGVIVLVDCCADGWRISIPRNDELREIDAYNAGDE